MGKYPDIGDGHWPAAWLTSSTAADTVWGGGRDNPQTNRGNLGGEIRENGKESGLLTV